MGDKCLRPGWTEKLTTVGVCLTCANSEWNPKKDGVQYRETDGTFRKTPGYWK